LDGKCPVEFDGAATVRFVERAGFARLDEIVVARGMDDLLLAVLDPRKKADRQVEIRRPDGECVVDPSTKIDNRLRKRIIEPFAVGGRMHRRSCQ
jgi:hypothetical protein